MNFSLATMIRRSRNPRRSAITLRPIVPPATLAHDLYIAAYKPVIIAWQRGIEAIGTRYEAALPLRDGWRDSIFDIDAILAAIEGSLQQLVINITPRLRDWSMRSEQWHRNKWRGAILAGTGIDPGTLLGASDVNDTVEAFVSRNVALIRSVSDDTKAKVSDIVLRSYAARVPLRTVAKEMAEAVDFSRKRALRIASDQSSKLAAGLDQARQEQAGITSFTWRWSHKLHGRQIHIAHDGKVYRWDDLPQVDGKDDSPGVLPFCGCRAQAYIDLS